VARSWKVRTAGPQPRDGCSYDSRTRLVPVVLMVFASCTYLGPQRSEGVYIPGADEEFGELTVLDDEQECVQADYDTSREAICYEVVEATRVDPTLKLGDDAQVRHEEGVARVVEPFDPP
jgi:hypothetical protein